MPRDEIILHINKDDLASKRRVMEAVGKLDGHWDVSFRERKKRRSLNANAYYHVAVVQPFLYWLRIEWGDATITHDQAHDVIKRSVLGVKTKANKATGEVIELVPTTHDKDGQWFSAFLDKAIELVERMTSTPVLPPTAYGFERKESK